MVKAFGASGPEHANLAQQVLALAEIASPQCALILSPLAQLVIPLLLDQLGRFLQLYPSGFRGSSSVAGSHPLAHLCHFGSNFGPFLTRVVVGYARRIKMTGGIASSG